MSKNQDYNIIRILSNNVILVNDSATNAELILLGKGLGFGQKTGHSVPRNDVRIEKRFRMDNEDHLEQYQSLVSQIDQTVIELAAEIISWISEEITSDINQSIHVALPDHIQFALQRIENNMEIVNPFLFEIQALYQKEYLLAERAGNLIEDTFKIHIPESEIGFLALHIHSAISNIPVAQTVKHTTLIREMVDAVEKRLNLKLAQDSLSHSRTITHFRFVLERLVEGKTITNPLLDRVKSMLPEAYQLAEELAELITEKLGVTVSEDEIGYMAMHLFRLFQLVKD
ncbi:PRD domain-containing protein [Brevibacillus daliensis]|uniref:PRD domain-containing protein n=1 Tax=Brevibacillus daliensis TaxID=2892995 RepID=UPI001E65D6EE|nr:PRD domain-containing protein [Brevibacillus daliensis]